MYLEIAVMQVTNTKPIVSRVGLRTKPSEIKTYSRKSYMKKRITRKIAMRQKMKGSTLEMNKSIKVANSRLNRQTIVSTFHLGPRDYTRMEYGSNRCLSKNKNWRKKRE